MTSDTLDSKLTHQHSLSSMFQWMPTCALIIDTNGIIQEVNQQAIKFFRASTKEDFIFDKQNINNIVLGSQRGMDLINIICRNTKPLNSEILLRRFDKTIASVEMIAGLFPDNPNHILIQFTETHTQSQAIISELSQVFRREAQQLKPYLNKPGKELLQNILINNVLEDTNIKESKKRFQLDVVREDLSIKLIETFPFLSNNELSLCGFLSLKMTIDEISNLTGKSSNSLRVLFHRILKKTNFPSGKSLLRKLESFT